MSAELEALRVAAERRAQAIQAEREAHQAFAEALKAAKAAKVGDKAMQEASGLTRQRLWQILRTP